MMSEAISVAEHAVGPKPFQDQGILRTAQPAQRRSGTLVGRPDLGNDEMLVAIAERLRFEGREVSQAAGVLKAALDGRPVALALLRRLVLPAPRSALSMPIQAILRETPATLAQRPSSTWSRLVSFGR